MNELEETNERNNQLINRLIAKLRDNMGYYETDGGMEKAIELLEEELV